MKRQFKNVKVMIRDVGVTGCSSELKEASKITGKGQSANDTSLTDYLIRQRYDKELRMTGLMYPSVPNLDKRAKRPNKAQRSKYNFYKLMQGTKSIGMFCHTKKGTLNIETADDLVEHMPWWVLRPWKLFDAAAMLTSGLLRVTAGKAVKKENDWKLYNPTPRYKAKYGYNLRKVVPDKPEQVTYKASNYWGDSPGDCMKLDVKVANDAVYCSDLGFGIVLKTGHISRDLGEMFSRYPWWARLTVAGYANPEAGPALDTMCTGARDRFKQGRKIVLLGGNWVCDGPSDSIRPLMCLAEKMVKNGKGPLDPKAQYFMHDNKRMYFAILPYIYESPQHGYHPVNCAFLSEKPIHFEKVWTK